MIGTLMAYDIEEADMRQMTAHWIEWGNNHMDAVKALLKGQACVVRTFRYADGKDYLTSAAMVHFKDNSTVDEVRLDQTPTRDRGDKL